MPNLLFGKHCYIIRKKKKGSGFIAPAIVVVVRKIKHGYLMSRMWRISTNVELKGHDN
jgi:hypothetical protein